MGGDRWRARAAAIGGACVVVLVASGCTGGGGENLSTDGQDAAAAAIAAAVEDARASSGRYRTVYSESGPFDDPDEPAEELVSTGEFSPTASRSTITLSSPDLPGDATEWQESSSLEVDGRAYRSTDQLRLFEPLSDSDESEEIGGVDGTTSAETFDLFQEYDFRALDGKDWVDATPLLTSVEGSVSGLDPMVESALRGWISDDPFALLGVVEAVEEGPPAEIDAAPVRHFTATIPQRELLTLVFGEEALSDVGYDSSGDGDVEMTEEDLEYERRQEVADRYVADRTSVTADLFLDTDDQLRRVVVVASTEIESDYEDCWLLSVSFSNLSFTTDFSDLGGEISIEAPDPATVISLDDVILAFPAVDGSDDFGDVGEVIEPVTLETVDGPRDRFDVLNDLDKFGYVIGLGVDPWTLSEEDRMMQSMDPGVWELSDDELVARYDETDAALAAMVHTTTSLGELTRPELLWNVKWGLDTVGADAAAADTMSDAQMGELIDGFVAQRGGPVGDGVWGSLPVGVDLGAEDFLGGGEFDPGSDDEYEGCPI